MPQNILNTNQTPLVSGLNRSIEQNQYHQNNNYNNNPCKNTTFGTNSISKLNQGKFTYLNEKFSNKTENNYDELINTATNTNCPKKDEGTCSCCFNEEKPIKTRKNFTHSESNQKKRLSCEELEDLSERFADFIKIDSMMMINNNISSKKCNAPMPPPPLPRPLFNRIPSPPLPPPPAEFLNDNFSVESNKKQEIVQIPSRLSSRLSVLSAESSSGDSSLSSSSSNSSTNSTSIVKELKSSYSSVNINRPEPPQRTVSIRNSTCNVSLYSNTTLNLDEPQYAKPMLRQPPQDDSISIKSNSIYSSCHGGSIGPSFRSSNHQNSSNSSGVVRSSRSVFSIYEEEDESSCAASSSASSSSSSSTAGRLSSASTLQNSTKLERLNEFEVKKIESMYRSIGSVVHVSPCTCDLFTTTSEQIALLLNDCWKLEINSIVPIWIFDTGFNPKRQKQLRLLFVDRHTAFPLTTKNIIINKFNQLTNPSGDKRLTFTLRQKQLVCLMQFCDFFSCQEFFKFYTNLINTRNFDIFGSNNSLFNDSELSQVNTNANSRMNQSRSMMSLSKIPDSTSSNLHLRNNRYSEYLDESVLLSKNNFLRPAQQKQKSNNMKMKSSATTGNLKNLQSSFTVQHMTITKNCISNPCAFLHINSLKDGDQRVKLIVENCENTDRKL